MTIDKKIQANFYVTWFYRVGLLTLCAFFLMKTYNKFEKVADDVSEMKIKIAIIETKLK